MPLTFSKPVVQAIPLTAVTKDGYDDWLNGLEPRHRVWAQASDFRASVGTVLTLPNPDGSLAAAVAGLGSAADQKRGRFLLGAAREKLPEADFELHGVAPGAALEEAALGWLLAGYRFDRYAKSAAPGARLISPPAIEVAKIEAIAAGEALTRDLINTPPSDMGPDELEAAARRLASQFGANVHVVADDALLQKNFPMIHAVGRASVRAPRLIDLTWGKSGPRLTLVGEGVCFDTGGLNIKPGASMGMMKKDMGGAATVLG
ncbi:MAG: leucyl aminopeptidase family protein, partial [Paracoccaceae bacterium]